MLEGIFEFVQWLGTIIETVFNFFANILTSFISFFKIIPTIFITSSIGYLPSMVMVFATVSITVAIIFLVLGRNNN